jgi:hypothetical protein
MSWLGDYTVYGDLPVTYSDSQIEGISAWVVLLLMEAAGYDGDSVVNLISTDPTSSVANPQIPGFQLCKCDLQVMFPDDVDSASTEMLIATGLAFYSAALGLPGNVILTLNQVSTSASLGAPTVPLATISVSGLVVQTSSIVVTGS